MKRAKELPSEQEEIESMRIRREIDSMVEEVEDQDERY